MMLHEHRFSCIVLHGFHTFILTNENIILAMRSNRLKSNGTLSSQFNTSYNQTHMTQDNTHFKVGLVLNKNLKVTKALE